MAHHIVRFVVLCLGVLCTITLQAQNSEQMALEAENAYLSGNYALAAELYTQLIDGGVRDFSIYFNAGSAYYQNGELGHSLYYFLKAQRLNPRSQALNLNIARIRSERVDYLPESSQLLDVLGSASITLVTLQELQIITLIVWSLWFGLWSIFFFRIEFRSRIHFSQWVVGVVLAMMLIFMISRMLLVRQRPMAVVTSPVAQVMSGPGESYLVLYRLFSAAEMRVVSTSGNWVRFSLGDGRQGWISRDAITRIDH